jgi:hypothetical protein
MSNSTIENMNIFSSLFILFRADFSLQNVQTKNITRDSSSTGRLFRIESNSNAVIQDSSFEDINFSLISVTDSTFEMHNSYIENITASQYIIECYKSTGIVMDNLTIFDSQTDDRPGIMNFRD